MLPIEVVGDALERVAPYVVGGSLASTVQGVVRTTLDAAEDTSKGPMG